jgi:uncharacterized ParB-like nuclease family protein
VPFLNISKVLNAMDSMTSALTASHTRADDHADLSHGGQRCLDIIGLQSDATTAILDHGGVKFRQRRIDGSRLTQ